jgi:hypothetical protein
MPSHFSSPLGEPVCSIPDAAAPSSLGSSQQPAVKGFAPPTSNAPAFTGVRAAPGQKYAVEKAKQQLKAMFREARAAGREPLTEAAAHSYLLGATYVLDRRFISEEIPVKDFASIMHCDSRTARRARNRLVAEGLWEIIKGGQGRASIRIKMPVLVGPIFAEKGGAAAVDNAATSGTRVRSSRQPLSSESEVATADYMYLEEVGTSTTTDGGDEAIFDDSITVDEQRDALFAAAAQTEHVAERFCDWWPAAYPSHNHGVQNRVRQCDRDAAIWLLGGRTIELVQAMAVLMWANTSPGLSQNDRAFIAQSDKSIRVLLEKQTVIEREVLRLERRASQQEQRQSPVDELAEHIDRVRERLKLVSASDSPTSLYEAIARIAQELSTLEVSEHQQEIFDRLRQLDVELVLEARAVTGEAELQRMRVDADQEFADFRESLGGERYETALDQAVDRLVREHFRLPTIAFA